MGERKVLNKYIPADFDPSLIPRGKKLSSKDGTVPVRMMLPFSMQCDTCKTFLYRGRKYNSKKEAVQGAAGKYLGIQRFRFYIKCSHCSRPISFLTDPKNADYEMESGATRNFEMHRNTKKEGVVGDNESNKNHQDEDQGEDDADEFEQQQFNTAAAKDDPMKALENRVLDSQREMADLDNLEEIKAMNARHLRIDPLEALQILQQQQQQQKLPLSDFREGGGDKDATTSTRGGGGGVDSWLTEEDEALIRSIRFQQQQNNTKNQQPGRGPPAIKRLTAEDEERLDQEQRENLLQLTLQKQRLLQDYGNDKSLNHDDNNKNNNNKKRESSFDDTFPAIIVKRKKRQVNDAKSAPEQQPRLPLPRPQPSNASTTTKSESQTTGVHKNSQHQQEEKGQETSGGLTSLLGGYGSESD